MKKTTIIFLFIISSFTIFVPCAYNAFADRQFSDTLAAPTIFKLPGRTNDQFAVEPFILGHTAALYDLQKKDSSLSGAELKARYAQQLLEQGKVDPSLPNIIEMIQWDFVKDGYFPFIVGGQSFVIRFFDPAQKDLDSEKNTLFSGVLTDTIRYEVVDTFNKISFLSDIAENRLDTIADDLSFLLDNDKFNSDENTGTASAGFSLLLRLAPKHAARLFSEELDAKKQTVLLNNLSQSDLAYLARLLGSTTEKVIETALGSLLEADELTEVLRKTDAVKKVLEAQKAGQLFAVDNAVYNDSNKNVIAMDTAINFILGLSG